MADIIFMLIVLIPIYGLLLWTYFDPRGSFLWGKRWMYKEEPELSEEGIRYAKVASAISIVILTTIFLVFLFK